MPWLLYMELGSVCDSTRRLISVQFDCSKGLKSSVAPANVVSLEALLFLTLVVRCGEINYPVSLHRAQSCLAKVGIY